MRTTASSWCYAKLRLCSPPSTCGPNSKTTRKILRAVTAFPGQRYRRFAAIFLVMAALHGRQALEDFLNSREPQEGKTP